MKRGVAILGLTIGAFVFLFVASNPIAWGG
jgi:hypothetical protein